MSDVVCLPCWLLPGIHITLLIIDGNAKTMLLLPDGYLSTVTSDKFCDQTAIRNGKGVPKGIQRSAD